MKIQRQRRHPMETLVLLGLLIISAVHCFTPNKHTALVRRATYAPLRQTRLRPLAAVAKSGGKMILTDGMYAENVLSKDISKPVLVFFSAPWCGPCRLTNPVVKEVMKQYSGEIDVVEVCTDDLAEIAEQAGIVSIPTIQFYYGGEILETIVGCVAKSVLANAVDKVLDDVQQLRQKAP